MANLFDQFDAPASAPPANVFDHFDQEAKTSPAADSQATWGQRLHALGAGAASMAPDVLGMPVDLASAAYGTGRMLVGQHLLGESPSEAASHAPDVGAGEWLKSHIAGLMGNLGDPFSNPRPDDALARMAHTGGNMLASAATMPAEGLGAALGNVGRMIPSAVGGAVGQEAGGSLGGLAGATLPMLLSGRPAPSPAVAKAYQAGLVIPPADANPTVLNRAVQTLAGNTEIQRSAAAAKQPVLDQLAKQALGLKPQQPLSPAVLQQVRAEAGAVYGQISNFPQPIQANQSYLDKIAGLGNEYQAAAKEFPELIKKSDDIAKMQNSLFQNQFSASSAVEASRSLREAARDNLTFNASSSEKALGRAQRAAASAVESLVSDNLRSAGSGALADTWDFARAQIAKAHNIEDALNPETGHIDAKVLARAQDKGVPLSGPLKLIADHYLGFPKSTTAPQTPSSTLPGHFGTAVKLIPALMAGEAMGGHLAGGALVAGSMAAPPLMRSLLLSKAYQSRIGTGKAPVRNALAPYLASQEDNQ